MRTLIVNPMRFMTGLGTSKAEVDAVDSERAGSQQTCLHWHGKGMYWHVRFTMAGLRIGSRGTRCRGTAAQWHISALALQDIFTAYRREHVDSSTEEACFEAFAQARSQKIYFPGEQWFYSVSVKLKERRFSTPSCHSLELALQHRKQALTLFNKDPRAIAELRSRLKKSSHTKKLAWQAHMHGMHKQLLGYISCELHNRKRVKTVGGRRVRLRGKQSVTQRHEGTMLLPWLTGFLVDQTTSSVEVQEGLRAFLDSDGVTSLQDFLRGAVNRHLTGPQLALEEEEKRCVPAARKRKSTSSMTRSAHRPANPVAKDHSAAPRVGKTNDDEQSSREEWGPRLRPRIAAAGK